MSRAFTVYIGIIVDGINEAGKKAKEAIDNAGDAVSGFLWEYLKFLHSRKVE